MGFKLRLSERQALRLVGMSASTLRYQPRDDGNGRLRERAALILEPIRLRHALVEAAGPAMAKREPDRARKEPIAFGAR